MKNSDREIRARKILKATGLYCTEHRVAILKVLLAAKAPMSQEQIAIESGKKHFDKVTIYRTIESLMEKGLVHKAFIEKRASFYELAHNCSDKQCHPHFTCTKCGCTHCLKNMSIPMTKSPYKGFVIQHQKIHLEGLCPSCA